MFKKLSDLEKSMCSSLNYIKDYGTIPNTLPYGSDDSIAMHQCLPNGFIENLDEWKDANGDYHFDTLGHVHLNQNGMKFLRNMSMGFRIKNAIFDVLKGTLGYILGVATPLIVEAVLWIIRNSKEIQEFLHHISQK